MSLPSEYFFEHQSFHNDKNTKFCFYFIFAFYFHTLLDYFYLAPFTRENIFIEP